MKIDAASLAIGELVGAACFISAVVAGAMALVAPDFRVARRSFVRDVSFFIIAVIMIMVFLADGHIRFWECMVMVVFYISYVIFVVGWHWFAGVQKRKRSTLRAAQNHYVALEEEVDDESDEEDDGGVGRGRGGRNNDMFSHDFAQLENGEDDDEASDDAHDQQAYAELSSNMRIVRPRTERTHTARSIRPSLVGALEVC
jgi:solute carrier family 24 (sodium/potassium/calcium exchanger), member 6